MFQNIHRGLGAASALVGLSGALLVAIPARAEPAARVRVDVSGFDSSKGKARCGLFIREGWGDEESMVAGAEATIEAGRAVCAFSRVSPGRYGVIVYHDENGNQRLDKNFLGIPTEAYCFSENAQGGLGVPDFAKASFAVEEGEVSTGCRL